MNKLSLTIAIAALFAALYASINKSGDNVSQKEFRAAHAEVLVQFDSVHFEISELNTKISEIQKDITGIKIDLDTVKRGNQVIYKTMNENKTRPESSFYDDLKSLLK